MIRPQVLATDAPAGVRPYTRRLATLVVALLALALLLTSTVAAYQLTHQGRVYQGVHLGGHDLSGTTPDVIRALLAGPQGPAAGQMTLHTSDGSHQWTATLATLGLVPDTDAVLSAAMGYGRSGDLIANLKAQWAALTHGVAIDMATQVDAAAVDRAVEQLATEVDHPPANGTLSNQGGTVTVVPGKPGVMLDRPTAARLLAAVLSTGGAAPVLALPVRVVSPALDDAALRATEDRVRVLTSAPVAVRVNGNPATLTITPDQLQAALVLAAAPGGGYMARLDGAKLAALLGPLVPQAQAAPHDAAVQLVKGVPIVNGDVPGWELDTETAPALLVAAAQAPDRTATLGLRPVAATIPTAAVQPVYKQWGDLLTNGFTFHSADESWIIKGSTLAGGLTLTRSEGGGELPYRLVVNTEILAKKVHAIAGNLNLGVREARFRLEDGQVKQVAAARDGQHLDEAASVAAGLAAVAAGQTEADLIVVRRPAPTANMSIPATVSTPDVLARSSTTYQGSSPERAHNVEFGTSLVDGALVPPGGEFDMNATLGPLTLDAGFQMGFGIVSDGRHVTTVPAEAGGICQVVTTLFHSVFAAGLPMTERNHHSYWIAAYGRPPSGLQGLDATIAPPEKNFRWRNTTGNWLLIKAHAERGVVNFELWGTSPGWKVQVDQPVITDVVHTNHAPIYERSYAIDWGTTRLVEHAQDGFTADIRRQVFAPDGNLLEEWHAEGTYLPSHDRYLIGQRGRPVPKTVPTPVLADPAPPAAPSSPDKP